MISVRGIYDGEKVTLLEKVELPRGGRQEVIVTFLELKGNPKESAKFGSDAEKIAGIQGCSVREAQKLLDLQGTWGEDDKAAKEILSIREALNKWSPREW
ncbi:MAG: hypothetical protein ACUVXI_17075 [bacterium]